MSVIQAERRDFARRGRSDRGAITATARRGRCRDSYAIRLDPDAETRGDPIVDADAQRPDGLHRARAGEHAVEGIAGVERADAEPGRADEVDPGHDVGGHLAEIVSDDRRGAGEGAAGKLGKSWTGLEERHVAGRSLHAQHDPVVEHMLIGQVGLAANAALDPLPSPDGDPRANGKTAPGSGARPVRQGQAPDKSTERSADQPRRRVRTPGQTAATQPDTKERKAITTRMAFCFYHKSACEALRFRLRHIDGAHRDARRPEGQAARAKDAGRPRWTRRRPRAPISPPLRLDGASRPGSSVGRACD